MAKDLTNVYKVDEAKGIVKYTIKAHGEYYTGKAKVNTAEGDAFDLETGKRIAKLRAILKMKRAIQKELIEYKAWIIYVKSLENEVTNKIDASVKSIENVEKKLEDVLSGVPQ